MTKAENLAEKALKLYPMIGSYDNFMKREGFIEGYHQAEKDLALTWEDLRGITDLCDKLTLEKWHEKEKFTNEEDFYKEVLKRFNETRNKRQ